jgi:bacteriophage N4 adsorption protein B
MPISGLDFVPPLLVAMKALMMLVCVLFLISGVDDIFIDLWFGLRWLKRRIFVQPHIKRLSEADLLDKTEQAIAVMLPAWDESAVIRQMLEHTIKSISYRNVHFFVGTYPNDLDTQREVERIRDKHHNVHRIVTLNDGPTNKADCLNAIYQGIRSYEKSHVERFEIFVIQDCEDVIHPLCFKLFNYLIPRKDMVQLPVHSLRRKWYEFTAGHYIDEFAQLHVKDLVVREFFSRSIPTAGVGVAFSRRSLEMLAGKNPNHLFNVECLTEDYDFAFRLREYGLKQVFARVALPKSASQRAGNGLTLVDRDLICVKEYFPKDLSAAVRQKSRWVVGIALQGWANLGWAGDWRTKYMLYRDRKVLVTNLINVLGYMVAAVVLAAWLILWIDPESYRYPPLLERDSILWYVVLVNAILLVIRILVRGLCVHVLYGWQQALLAFPRMIWGNFVNFLATCRAIRLYARYLRTGKLIAWDKTAHVFPAEEDLLGTRRRLGEILLDNGLITVDNLNTALVTQQIKREPLGRILVDMGVLKEQELRRALLLSDASFAPIHACP